MFSKRGRRYFFWSRHIALWELIAVAAVLAIPLLFAPLIDTANNANGDYTGGYSGYQEYGSNHISVWSWTWLRIHLFAGTYHDDIDALSTFIIATFTVVLAWSTWRLWRETERLAKGADQQTKRLVESINEAKRSANAAEQMATAVVNNAQQELRAYVSTTVMELNDLQGSRPHAEVRLYNSGQTPAFKVDWQSGFFFEPFPLPDAFEFPFISNMIASLVIHPREGMAGFCQRDDAFSAADLAAARNAKSGRRLYIMGVVYYRDAPSGDLRHSRVCVSIPPGDLDAMLQFRADGIVHQPVFEHAWRFNDAT